MDEDNPPPQLSSSSRPYRIRRPSSSIISSTTSPAFPAPANPSNNPQAGAGGANSHRSRLAASLQLGLGGNNSTNNSNNGRDIDEDLQCQPSSSTTFTPPSPRPRPISTISSSRNNSGSVSPLGSPDSTFWGTAPSPISNFRNHGPATPGGMCQVSSSTVDDVPPSPMQFSADELTNNVTNNSNSSVMLPPLAKAHNQRDSGGAGSAGSSSSRSINSTPILLSNLQMNNLNAASSSAASSSSTSTSNIIASSSSSSFSSNTLRNKIKKASSFERFSLQAANSLSSNNEVIPGPSSGTSSDSLGALAGGSSNLHSGFNTSSISLNGTNLNSSLSATNNPILAASLSSASQNSQASSPDHTNQLNNGSSSGASNNGATSNSNAGTSNTRFLWDSIIQSSGASALRQLFHSSSSSSEGKSLHIKIPSKKLAAKIASVFEQEEQQLLQQQQQNDLMNSLLSGHTTSQLASETAGPPSLHAIPNGLNIPHTGGVLGDDPVVDLMNDVTVNDSHENLMRELSESPLNLTDTSANTSAASHLSRNSRNLLSTSSLTSNLNSNLNSHLNSNLNPNPNLSSLNSNSLNANINTNSNLNTLNPNLTSSLSSATPKKIPLTPKQKLLHRMQSGELLSMSPPPMNSQPQQSVQQHQQQQPTLLQTGSLNFHNGSLLQDNLQQPQHSPHQLDPYYENLLRNRDEFIPDNLPLPSQKNSEDPNSVSVLYDADAYSYYYGNMLSDEIFATTTTTSSTTSSSGRPLLMMPGTEAVDSLQSDSRINAHGHVEFILGIDEDMDGRGGTGPRDDLQLDPQFLDGENLNKSQDSTLRNLLMMGPIQHEDTNWIHSDYSRSGRSVQMTSTSNGNGVNLNINSNNINSWMMGNDWTRSSWSHVGLNMGSGGSMQAEEQDEVMDMSVMDSPEKQQHKQRHGGNHTLVDQQDIDDVDLLGSMQMPMDLQQPLGIISSLGGGGGSNTGGGTLNLQGSSSKMGHESGSLDVNSNPVNLQHQHRCATSSLDDDEPVNLIAVNLDSDLTQQHQQHNHHSQTHTIQSSHHHPSSQLAPEDMDHLPNTVLQHSSVLSNRHCNHMDSNKQSQMQCGGYITLHAAPNNNDFSIPPQDLNSSTTSSSSENDNIDERRIIRVKKPEVINIAEDDCSPGGGKSSSAPSIILDKPIQPKSFASLPSPLSLIRVAGNSWAVFTARYKTIAVNTRFGPVEGPLKRAVKDDMTCLNAVYPCLVMLDSSNALWQLDRADDELCNWMKFVRFARNSSEQNAVITEDRGLLYFSTMKEIPPKTELQVGYSLEYAQKYGLPMLETIEDGSGREIFQNGGSCPGTPLGVLGTSSGMAVSSRVEEETSRRDSGVLFGDYPCLECQQDFTSGQDLNHHMESVHRDTLQESVLRRACKKKNMKKLKFLEEAFVAEPSNPEVSQSKSCRRDHLGRNSIDNLERDSVELERRTSGAEPVETFPESGVLERDSSGIDLIERTSGEDSEHPLDDQIVERASSSDSLVGRGTASEDMSKVAPSKDLGRSLSTIKQGRYECNTCQAIVPTLVDLTKHVAQHYEQNQASEDAIIMSPRSLKSQKGEESQVTNSTSNSVLTSSWKEKEKSTGNTESSPTAVISTTSVITKVKCTMCYKSFATKDRLDKHMIVHSDEETKPLQCEFCPKRFLTNSALAGHIKTHAEEGKCFECPMCDFVTQQLLQLKEHVQTHKNKESGMFYCPKCSKKFLMYSMVRKHIRAFHGPRQFTCDQCPMSFPTSDKLKLHKLKHSDHREFLCAECGRQFKRKDKLREHTKRMHENRKKPSDLHHLHGHLSSKHRHSKKFVPKTSPEEFEKFIYKCADCMMGFKRRGMLVNHLAKRHPERPPQQVPELNMPILRPTRNYFCPYCDRVYKSSSKRKSHILKSHPGKALPPQLKGKDSLCLNEADRLITVCVSTSEMKVPHHFNNTMGSKEKKNDTIVPPNPQQYREVSVVGKVMATPHSCEWCHRQYATRAKLLQHQRKSHLHLMPPDMQLPRTQKNNVVRQMEADALNVGQNLQITSANIISGNVTLNGASGIVFATGTGGNSEITSSGVVSSGTISAGGVSGTTSSGKTSGTILARTTSSSSNISSGVAEAVSSVGTSRVTNTGANPGVISSGGNSGNISAVGNVGRITSGDRGSYATEVIVAHILKNQVLTDQLPSSSTSSLTVLAPDSSTQPETVITVDSSGLIPSTQGSSSASNHSPSTTTIALTEQQLQQLQLQGLQSLTASGEESGNVIGFLLTTTSGDLSGLVPSEIVVVPVQQQHHQPYPVISAATANAIQQAVLNSTSASSSTSGTSVVGNLNNATLLPLTSSIITNHSNNNNGNILSNVISSSAVAGINVVNNPILNPTE